MAMVGVGFSSKKSVWAGMIRVQVFVFFVRVGRCASGSSRRVKVNVVGSLYFLDESSTRRWGGARLARYGINRTRIIWKKRILMRRGRSVIVLNIVSRRIRERVLLSSSCRELKGSMIESGFPREQTEECCVEEGGGEGGRRRRGRPLSR